MFLGYNKRMKIAIYSDSYYPLKNGVSNYLLTTIDELVKIGHKILVVAPAPKDKKLTDKMIAGSKAKLVLLPSVPAMFYPGFRLAAPSMESIRGVRKFNPDVIHFHTPGPVSWEGIMAAKMLKKPLVGTLHTYFMEPEGFKILGVKEEGPMADFLQKALWAYAGKLYKASQVIVAPTKYVAEDLKKRWTKKKVIVIPGGVEVGVFANQKNRLKLRKKYDLEGKTVVLWIGRLSQEKNLDLLVMAFARLAINSNKLRLVLVGDGPARPGLEYYAQALGVYDKVKFLGGKEYEAIKRENYYSLGDVFVSPSTWETQGLNVIEAMAAGLPTVVTDARAMPEIVGKWGMVVKKNNALSLMKGIEKAIKYKDKHLKRKEGLQKKAGEYSVEKSVNQLLKLYEKLAIV